MVLDSLGESLQSSLDSLRNTSRVTEDELNPVIKDIQRSLLQSDVSVDIVQELSATIEDRALSEEPPRGTSAREHILRIVYEELVDIVGDSTDIPLQSNQTILLAGLQGNGKTTTSAKIAWWLKTKGLKPAIIQTDTDRPGAHAQTEQMADKAEVQRYTDTDANDPVQIARDGIEATSGADVRIIDTAGRHALEDELINEIETISSVVEPDHTFLVMDAAIGQGASTQAERFNEAIGITGAVITKLDGTAKGGGALAAVDEADASIAFLGTGEEVDAIERFEPSGFISRLLGMGDLKQLSERIERAMSQQDENDDWEPEDMLDGEFTLVDMKKQLQTMDDMGPLSQVVNMVPGLSGNLGSIPDDALETTQEELRTYEIIMDSMTESELENPSCVDTQRIRRIARGSGCDEEDVRQLLNRHKRMKKMLNGIRRGGGGRGGMKKLLNKMDVGPSSNL